MSKGKRKSVVKIVLEKIIGLVIFLVIVALANIIVGYFDSPINRQVIQLVNSNLVFLIALSVIFALGEIFGALIFPFNLPAPLFNATGSVFLVTFLFRIFELLDSILDKDILQFFDRFSPIIYPLVFVIVLTAGYILIFIRLLKKDKSEDKEQPRPKQDRILIKLLKTGFVQQPLP